MLGIKTKILYLHNSTKKEQYHYFWISEFVKITINKLYNKGVLNEICSNQKEKFLACCNRNN